MQTRSSEMCRSSNAYRSPGEDNVSTGAALPTTRQGMPSPDHQRPRHAMSSQLHCQRRPLPPRLARRHRTVDSEEVHHRTCEEGHRQAATGKEPSTPDWPRGAHLEQSTTKTHELDTVKEEMPERTEKSSSKWPRQGHQLPPPLHTHSPRSPSPPSSQKRRLQEGRDAKDAAAAQQSCGFHLED